ncbi:adenylate/guanylate cyclase domain-containing protein [Anaerolineales bacterium HSG6]|nr:adenylate/guanylate cyclase domain-containing protein [Anaerolineales bacterium HSG6]
MTTFLFTDIEASTRLWEKYGDMMQTVLALHDQLLSKIVRNHGGKIIRHRGDGLSIVFESGKPLDCAIAMQQAIQQADWGELESFRIRIGLHAGQAQVRRFKDDTIGQKEEYFGRALNRTARVMDAASGGQIVFTPDVLEETNIPPRATIDDLGLHLLKNLDDPQPILGLLHPSLPQTFPPLKSLARIDAKRPITPYKGLAAFDEEDAPFFFGREIFTDLLLQVVERQPLSTVIGPSGSGKSSVVYAGLVPYLRKKSGQVITDFRPGSQPVHALATVLAALQHPSPSADKIDNLVAQWQADPTCIKQTVEQILDQQEPTPQRLILIANQFEEMFTLCDDPAVRRQFLNLLFALLTLKFTHPVSACHVVLTLRADFMAQALSHRPFADAVQVSGVILGPMIREELERVVKLPAEQQGVQFESGLVERILNDVGQEAGNLPLLQFALTLLWERQENFTLTHAAYESIGRVEGALTHHADLIYQELSPIEQSLTHKIFIQLVTPGEGTEDTRRMATRAELGEENWMLVQQLADARLVVTNIDPDNQEVVEVVHEALIRNWGQLHVWLNEDRVFRSWQERLRTVLVQWRTSGRDRGALLRGALLVEAEEWFNQRQDELSQQEHEFIQTSLQQRDAELSDLELQRHRELEQAQALARSQQHRAEIQARSTYRLRWMVAGLGVVILMALSAAWWAYGESNRAQAEAQARATEVLIRSTAEAEAVAAQEEAIEAEALAVRESKISLIQSILAHALRLTEQTNDTELTSLLALEALAINQDIDGPAQSVIDRFLRRMLQHPYFNNTLTEHTDWVNHITYSPDGRWLASASDDFTVRLWDMTQTYKTAIVLNGHTHWVWAVAFSPDSNTLASAGRDGRMLIWDMADLSEPTHELIVGEDKEVIFADFSPDGQWLAAATNVTGTVWIWPTNDYQAEPTILSGHELDMVRMVRFSPDGMRLASAGDDGTIRIWSMADLSAEPIVLSDHEDRVRSIDFSPDGTMLASGSSDTTIRLWDMTNPLTPSIVLDEHTDIVRAVRFHPDGKRLVSSATDGTIRLWDLANLGQHDVLQGDELRVISAAFHPDGNSLATSGFIKIRLWDLNEPTTPLIYQSANVRNIQLSIDGQSLLVNSNQQKIERLSLDGLQPIETVFERETEPKGTLVISSDESQVAYQEGAVIKLVTIDNQQTIHEFPIIDKASGQVKFSPDGQYLAIDHVDSQMVQLWSLDDFRQPIELFYTIERDGLQLAFSPDGQTLVGGTRDGKFYVWSLSTTTTEPQLVQGSLDTITTLAFSADGQTLAVGYSEDYTIYLWNMADLQAEPQQLVGHELQINSIQFSSDGQMLVSSSDDNAIRLWDLTNPTADPKVLLGHSNDVLDVVLTADKQLIASAGEDNSIRLWLTNLNTLVYLTCQQVQRNLSAEEWTEYLRDDYAYAQTCPELPVHSSVEK